MEDCSTEESLIPLNHIADRDRNDSVPPSMTTVRFNGTTSSCVITTSIGNKTFESMNEKKQYL